MTPGIMLGAVLLLGGITGLVYAYLVWPRTRVVPYVVLTLLLIGAIVLSVPMAAPYLWSGPVFLAVALGSYALFSATLLREHPAMEGLGLFRAAQVVLTQSRRLRGESRGGRD